MKVSEKGLQGLSIAELLRLYDINLRSGQYDDFHDEIHLAIQKKNITPKELLTLTEGNKEITHAALFYYASYYHKDDISLLKFLVEHGVDLEAENHHGETVLNYALQSGGYNDIVKYLVASGANVYHPNKSGAIPFDLLKIFPDFLEQISHHKPERNNMKTKKPDFIYVADKPLPLGGKIKKITVAEFEAEEKIDYREGIEMGENISAQFFRENISGDLSSADLEKQINRLMKTPQKNLVLCRMKDCGWGVFTQTDIPKDTVVAIYSGTVAPGTQTTDHHDEGLGYYGTDFYVNTLQHRGLASFMQHLPEKPRFPDAKKMAGILRLFGQTVSEAEIRLNVAFYNTQFSSPVVQASVQTENIRKEYLVLDGVPVIALVSNEPITAGSQLGFNYGYPYWHSRKQIPEFFDREGASLPHHLYKRTFARIEFDGFIYTGELAFLVDQVQPEQTHVTVKGDDGSRHSVPMKELVDRLRYVGAVSDSEVEDRLNVSPKRFTDKKVLPEQVRIVDETRQQIAVFEITQKSHQRDLGELRDLLGNIIRKHAFLPVYEIHSAWLIELRQANRKGFGELAVLLETSSENLSALVFKEEQASCSIRSGLN